MRYVGHLVSAALLAVLASGHAHAQASAARAVHVENAWARATPTRATTAAAYMTVINTGRSADRLLSADTPVAQTVQFHKESEENGISRMRALSSVEIDPGAKVVFKPSDMHMMMTGLKAPLKEGGTFPLTLQFEKAGKVEITVPVAKVGAMQYGDMSSVSHGPGGSMKKYPIEIPHRESIQ